MKEITRDESILINVVIGMWNQYCGEMGHCCMSAGEMAEGILEEYAIIPEQKKGYFKGYIEEIDVPIK